MGILYLKCNHFIPQFPNLHTQKIDDYCLECRRKQQEAKQVPAACATMVMAIPKDAICPKCKSENTVLLNSDLNFDKNQKPMDTSQYGCIKCRHIWKIVKEAQL
jgi:hypothetical protein